jgi:hypothetical protein
LVCSFSDYCNPPINILHWSNGRSYESLPLALIIEELNDSYVVESAGIWYNGSFIYTTNPFIDLTEEDFKIFPKLEIIRDNSQKSSSDMATYFRIKMWVDEKSAFVSHFGEGGYWEYQGKRYWFGFMNTD